MDFRQLEYIIAIADEHTLLAASKKLFLSPSALSQHISRLEEELGTPLFKRTKQGWTPTHAGQIYIDMAQQILEKQKRAYLQIRDIADNKTGRFNVGVTAGRGTLMFSVVFPKFHNAFPDVKIGLFEGTVREICEQISAGKVDVGFITGIAEHPNITTMYQATEDIVLVVPKTHPHAYLANEQFENDFPTIHLQQFENDEFLLAGEGTTLRTLENNLFSQAGFTPKVAFETPSLLTLNMLSKGGYGLAFIPYFYADPTSDAVYFRTEPAASWELVAAYQKGHYLTKAERHMIKLVTDYYNTPHH